MMPFFALVRVVSLCVFILFLAISDRVVKLVVLDTVNWSGI